MHITLCHLLNLSSKFKQLALGLFTGALYDIEKYSCSNCYNNTSIMFIFQFWLRTASQSTPPSWTPTSTWLARMRPALLISAWLSLLTARVDRGPASQRKLAFGIAETASGRTSTSTAQAPLLRPSSEVRTTALGENWQQKVSLRACLYCVAFFKLL